jgi:hypothetical protein
MQGRLIPKRAMQDRLDRLHRGREPVEVEQGLGRENTGYPDLVVGRWHRSPLQVEIIMARLLRSCFIALCAPFMAGEFRHPGETG